MVNNDPCSISLHFCANSSKNSKSEYLCKHPVITGHIKVSDIVEPQISLSEFPKRSKDSFIYPESDVWRKVSARYSSRSENRNFTVKLQKTRELWQKLKATFSQHKAFHKAIT